MPTRRVVVVGAGVIGVTTAHALLANGYEVHLLDAAATPASATSHANGGFLSAAFCAPWATPSLPKQVASALLDFQAPFRWRPDGSIPQMRWLLQVLRNCKASTFVEHRKRMVQLALYSRNCMQKVISRTGVAFDLREAGVLLIFRNALQEQGITQRLNELQGFGIQASWCDAEQLRILEPELQRTTQLGGAIYVPDDASGDCERFVQGLLSWNVARGLNYQPNTRVEGLELDASGKTLLAVRSGERHWKADAFVFATGVESARLLKPYMSIPVAPVKGYSVTVRSDTQYGGPKRAIIDESSKLAVTRLGDRIRLAGMAEVVGFDSQINRARCAQLVQQYQALYGALPNIDRSDWSGLRPMTPDGTPIVGSTAIDRLYLNTGHGTFGWTMACASAQLLADIVANRPTALDADSYALNSLKRNPALNLSV
jgi:D-amino-acid dehydrogenase